MKLDSQLLIIIFIIMFVMLCHVYQAQGREDFEIEEFEDLEAIEEDEKDKLVVELTDKLRQVNNKLHQFDDKKPIDPKVFRSLFEKQLPNYLENERGSKSEGYNLYDISQRIQDDKLDTMDVNLASLAEKFNHKFGENKEVKSIKSHINGKNLNIIQGDDGNKLIPINNGCLFVVNDETGQVDYDVTNYYRKDKNKLCQGDNPDQHFQIDKVANLEGYKAITGSSYLNEPVDLDTVDYPFYVVRPKNFLDKCLQSDSSGVKITPCNYEKSQRWAGYNQHRPCDCK